MTLSGLRAVRRGRGQWMRCRAVVVAVLAGLLAASVSGVAFAQSVETTPVPVYLSEPGTVTVSGPVSLTTATIAALGDACAQASRGATVSVEGTLPVDPWGTYPASLEAVVVFPVLLTFGLFALFGWKLHGGKSSE